MGLFQKKKPELELLSPLTGDVIPVSECPDPVFAGKVLGDGIAVNPTDGKVYAPVDGTVVQIAHTGHAFCIAALDGLELLIHLGMDTVKLDGKGFTSHVQVGQAVKKGDLIMEMDLAFIKSQDIRTISPCIITNMDQIKVFTVHPGQAEGGKGVVLTYKLV